LVPRCIEKISDAGVRLSGAMFHAPSWTISGNIRTVESSPSKPQREEVPISYSTPPVEHAPRYESTQQPEVQYSPPPIRDNTPYPTPATSLIQAAEEFSLPAYEAEPLAALPQEFAEAAEPSFDESYLQLTAEESAAMEATELPPEQAPKLTGLLNRLPASHGDDDHNVA
jgi:hypothetical protein